MKQYRIKLIIIVLLTLISSLYSSPTQANITFIGGSLTGAGAEVSNGAGRGFQSTIAQDGTLVSMTVQRPTGTQVNDCLIAMFIVRPQGTNITSPSGWNLFRRTTQVSGGNNTPPCGLDIISYFKILQVGETGGGSDTWYISYPFTSSGWTPTGTCTNATSQNTVAIGAMLAFRGQFPLSPVYYAGDDYVNNGSSTTHFAPSITIGVKNTMIVAGIGWLDSDPFGVPTRTGGVESTQPTIGVDQWACPATTCAAGSQERVANDVGLGLQMSYFNQALPGATGTVTSTATAGAADNGVGHMVAISEATSPIDLAITKTAVVSTTPKEVIYTISATNNGVFLSEPGPITVIDTLPPELTYLSFSGTGWACSQVMQTITCKINGPLACCGASTPNLTITATYNTTAVVTNCATLTGSYGDNNYNDNSVCRADSVNGATLYSGYVYLDSNQNSTLDGGETGIGQTLYIKVTPRVGTTCGISAMKAVPTNSVTGSYGFGVANGDYCLILSTNNNLSDVSTTVPGGYIKTQQPTGINNTFTAAGTNITNLNFGMYQSLNVSVTKSLLPSTDTGKFDLSIKDAGSTAAVASNVGDTGTTGLVVVTRGNAITVQEIAHTGTNLSNYSSTLSCVSNSGNTITLTGSNLTDPTTRYGTFTGSASGTAEFVACTFTNRPATLTIKKVIDSGVGGTFNFTATNPAIGSTGIAVAATNTPTTVAALTNVIIPSLSTPITITEADPSGISYSLSTAVCKDNSTGSTIASSLSTRTLTIAANTIPAGTDVVCTFTNTASTQDDHGDAPNGITVPLGSGNIPVSYGDASNRVSATVYLGSTAPDGDSTTFSTWQGQTTAAGDDSTGTADESLANPNHLLSGVTAFPAWTTANYVLTLVCHGDGTNTPVVNGWIDFNQNGTFDSNEMAQANCSSATSGTAVLTWTASGATPNIPPDLKTGNTYARFRISNAANATTGNSATIGEVEDYPITITRPPQLTVAKVIAGLFSTNPSDTFTVQITPGGPTATTTGVQGATTTKFSATAGTTYTLSETMGTGSLTNYNTTYSCVNSGTGGTTVASGTTQSFTVTPVANDDITCTFINTPKPTLQLVKTWGAGSTNPNAITVTTSGGTNNATISSTALAAGNTTTGTAVIVSSGNSITLPAETFTNGLQSNYGTTVNCTGNNTGLAGSTPPQTLTVSPGDTDIVCTYTNTPKRLVLRKNIGARINAADQFTISITGTSANSVNTSGATTGLQPVYANVALGAPYTYTIGESMVAGSSSTLSQYTATVSCTNSTSGGTNVSGVNALGALPTLNANDAVTCTITNNPRTMLLQKSIASRINAADQFQLSITTWTGGSNATTTGAATGLQAATASYTGAGNYTIAEFMGAGSVSALSQYTTTVACTNAQTTGATSVAGINSLGAFPFALTASDAVTCTITNTPKTLVLQKNIGARISSSDQFQLNITGTASNSATTSGATTGVQTATVASVTGAGTYTIGEAMAAGSSSTLTQYTTTVSCTNSKSGGTNVSGVTSLTTLPALTATDSVICTVTNTPKTLVLQKNITARINANDQFQLNITGAGSNSATTSGAATGVQAATASYTGAGNYTIGESMASGSVSVLTQYTATVACTNANSSGTNVSVVSSLGALPTLTTGDAVTCTITNTPNTLVLQKNIAARIDSTDQFKLDITGAGTGTATTSGATTGLQTATVASATGAGIYNIAESMASGSASSLSQYTITVACTNSKSGGTGVGGVTSLGALPSLASTDGVICTVTNTPKTLVLQKNISARIAAADQFTIDLYNGTTHNTATTSGAGTGVQAQTTSFTGAGSYTISETMAGGSTSPLSQYTNTLVCTNATAGGTDVSTFTLGTAKALLATDYVTCTITNTPKTLLLQKNISSRIAAADQFTIDIYNGTSHNNATTSGAATGVQAQTTSFTGAASYTISETMAGGSTSTLSQYTSTLACTNATAGGTDVSTYALGTAKALVATDYVTCTITNTPKTLILQKSISSRIAAADQFIIDIYNGSTHNTATTSGAGTGVQAQTTSFTGAASYTISETMAGGSTSTLSQYTSTLACTNATSGGTDVSTYALGTPKALTATDQVTCTITNTPKTLVLQKSIGARIAAADQFTIDIYNGTTHNNATTSGAGTGLQAQTTSFTGAASYTISETMAGGSTSALSQYTNTLACTNATSGGTDVSTYALGTPKALTAADQVTCTITNTPKTLVLQKNISSRVAAADQFTIDIYNGTTHNTATTSGSGTGLQAQTTSFTGAASYTISETMAGGSTSTLSQYTSTLACTNATAGGTDVSTFALGTPKALLVTDYVTCTITNTPKTLILQKSISSRIAAADQFTIDIYNGTTHNTATTSGAGTGLQAQTTSFTGAASYTISETMAGGSTSTLSQYTSTLACTNATSGGTDVSTYALGTPKALTATDQVTCTITNTPKTLVLQKSITARIAANDQFTIDIYNGTTHNNATTSGSGIGLQAQTTSFTGAASYTISETMAGGSSSTLSQYANTLACTNATSGGTDVSTFALGTPKALTATDQVTCTITNRPSATLRLAKAWGANSIAGDVASIGATTGLTNNTTLFTSTASTNTNGTYVTVYAGETATLPAETMSPGSLSNYTTTISCDNGITPSGTNGQSAGNTVNISLADSGKVITCTYTNTRKSATLTLQKTWVNAKNSETATVTTSGFANNASSGLSTSTGNNTTTGTAVTVYAGESGTISETMTNSGDYTDSLACTGNTTALSGSTLTVNPADTAIICTLTNSRKSATLTLKKTWANAAAGETATVTTSGFTNNASSGLSTSTGNNTTTGTSVTVYAGESGTISETMTNSGDYTDSLACTGNTTALSGSTLTVNPADTAIICTLTNSRKSATLTLKKTWANAATGETATVTTSGFTNNASSGLSTSTGNNTTTGTAVTVYAGESGTISETMTNSGDYTDSLACTGNTTALSGSTLTVNPADTAITCTLTNSRKSATLTLKKTWANAATGETATVTTSGFTNNASSGLSTSTGNNTTTGTSVTVYAGESGTISETMTNSGDYTDSLACTGNTTALSGSTLTVNPADTAIICTLTNSRKSATLTLKKTWANAATGETATVTTSGFTNNASSGLSTSTGNNTTTGTSVTVYAGELGTISETMTNSGDYTDSLACTGNTTALSGSTLTVNPADTAITCTLINTRKSATLRLSKVWGVNSVAGNVASIGATTGLINNTILFTSTASTNTTGGGVTVYAGETATLPAETMTTGSLSDYTTTLSCDNGITPSGTNGQSAGNTVGISSANAEQTITCTYTNTRKSMISIGAAKAASPVVINGDGTYTTTITINVKNYGEVLLHSVQVIDNLINTFPSPASIIVVTVDLINSTFTMNGGFNGDTNTNLLASGQTLNAGETKTAIFSVRFNPATLSGPFYNSATASGIGPDSTVTTDISNNGTNPDPYGDTPTPISIHPVTITPNRSGQTVPNSWIIYEHTVSNSDTLSSHDVCFSIASSNAWNWFITDEFGNILTSGATQNKITVPAFTPTVSPYGSVKIYIKYFVPSSVPDGTTEGTNILLHPYASGTCQNSYIWGQVTDTTVVNATQLRLTKQVRKCNKGSITTCDSFVENNTADPCDYLEYQISFKNLSTVPNYSLKISDVIPNYTEFVAGVYTGGKDVLVHPPSGPDQFITATIVSGTLEVYLKTLPTPVDPLQPGAEGYIQYKVRVKGDVTCP